MPLVISLCEKYSSWYKIFYKFINKKVFQLCTNFLGDLKCYETKHESYISLLNQLFDRKGDKMTLAKNIERSVP